MVSVKHDISLHTTVYYYVSGAHSAVAAAIPDYSSQEICQPSRSVGPPAPVRTPSLLSLEYSSIMSGEPRGISV